MTMHALMLTSSPVRYVEWIIFWLLISALVLWVSLMFAAYRIKK